MRDNDYQNTHTNAMKKYPSMVNISPAFTKPNGLSVDRNKNSFIINLSEDRKSPNFVQMEKSKKDLNINDISCDQNSVSKSSGKGNIIKIMLSDNGEVSSK